MIGRERDEHVDQTAILLILVAAAAFVLCGYGLAALLWSPAP